MFKNNLLAKKIVKKKSFHTQNNNIKVMNCRNLLQCRAYFDIERKRSMGMTSTLSATYTHVYMGHGRTLPRIETHLTFVNLRLV